MKTMMMMKMKMRRKWGESSSEEIGIRYHGQNGQKSNQNGKRLKTINTKMKRRQEENTLSSRNEDLLEATLLCSQHDSASTFLVDVISTFHCSPTNSHGAYHH
ncbi:hypothetical protein U0070_026003 [Myodes glareolus]|uniref:Uncharacterized protein n=1 Tax=Myodes glareolus TaxID=447135 RepID=A0AAW0J2V9_MYOGA